MVAHVADFGMGKVFFADKQTEYSSTASGLRGLLAIFLQCFVACKPNMDRVMKYQLEETNSASELQRTGSVMPISWGEEALDLFIKLGLMIENLLSRLRF
eukprot:XP_024457562.1 uncharacterized protein LOC112323282 isoform X2 [Populus trichocarpa]